MKQSVSGMIKTVTASNGENLLVRESAYVQFGTSEDTLGMVIMTNPGSFQLNGANGWVSGAPDPTMRSVIRVIKEAYQANGLEPEGRLHIHNLSNIAEPDHTRAKTKHQLLADLIATKVVSGIILEDPVVHSEADFERACAQAQFVMMGFVKSLFQSKYERLIRLAHSKPSIAARLIFAEDNTGHRTHPYTWLLKPELRVQAVTRLTSLLRPAKTL